MIPKIIHYCWFGKNPYPEIMKKCLSSWKKYCPEYEIKEWNESNFNINCNDYVREAYNAQKWAFVTDYARLDIIYNYGGIYLDIDVELIRSLDELLDNKCFLGLETTGKINTGLGFGAEAKNPIIMKLLNEYHNKHFKLGNDVFDMTPCPIRNTKPLYEIGYEVSNGVWKINEVAIYPPEYFCPLDYNTLELKVTENTYSIHHFNASWLTKEELFMEKEIDKINDENGKLVAFIKRHKFKYETLRTEKKVTSIMDYMAKEIRRKILRVKQK